MDKPPKAFEDSEFLQSPEGRSVRILSEYEKVKSLFEFHKIMDTITFLAVQDLNPEMKTKVVMKLILKTQNIMNKQERLHLSLQLGLKSFQKNIVDL